MISIKPKLYFIMSVLSLIVLAVLVYEFPKTVRTCEINEGMVGDVVSLSGRVASSRVSGDTTFLTLEDDCGSIPVVYFEGMSVRDGDAVKIRGEINKYKGELEVVALSIDLNPYATTT